MQRKEHKEEKLKNRRKEKVKEKKKRFKVNKLLVHAFSNSFHLFFFVSIKTK